MDEIIEISFVHHLNTVITLSLEEVKFWRIGVISDEMDIHVQPPVVVAK